jgi:hypothetical protein
MTRIFYLAVLGLALIGLTASADTITLDLTPAGGTVSGLPGSTVGWGYTIGNGSNDYLIVANSYFCESGQDPLFTTCTQALGTYSDFIANNGILIAPGDTGSQSFDASTQSGVGEYIIDPSATAGESDTGSLVVLYDLFDANFNQIGGAMELTAGAEVNVIGGASPVPEPRFPILLGCVLAALILCRAAGNKRPVHWSN